MDNKEFLYQKIYESLREGILHGDYPYASVLPSERVLCETFSAWRTTVRHALDMLVADGLIEKKAGFGTRVIYEQGKESSEPQDNVIGFFIASDITTALQQDQPYYSDLLYYLDMECKNHGCRFIMSTINSASDVENLMQNHFILVVYLSHNNFEYLETIKEHHVTTVLLNEEYENYPIIANDQIAAGFLAVSHLLELGHRRIGIITGPPSHLTVRRRLAGCYLAFSEYQLPNPAGSLMQIGDWEYESGFRCAKAMFSAGEEKPTAIFAFNDIMAIGALRALRGMGYNIPNDVSVISSDNIRQLSYTEPGLTTVDMRTQYTARAIVVTALNQIYKDLAPGSNIITPVELVIRSSVKDLRAK